VEGWREFERMLGIILQFAADYVGFLLASFILFASRPFPVVELAAFPASVAYHHHWLNDRRPAIGSTV